MTDSAPLMEILAGHGQEHLLRFWDDLDADQKRQLASDIESIDFGLFDRVWRSLSADEPDLTPEMISVPEAFPATASSDVASSYERAREIGDQLIRASRVAAMVVAGGQGTRLGFDGPKGAYPIAPITDKCLFQLFAESIVATNRRYHCDIPWYIMTSAANHDDTCKLFEESNWFGLRATSVRLFRQAMMPIADQSGKILLEQKHRVALSPNGHGGSLTALADSGALAEMAGRGVDYLSYFQVDNPLAAPVDPLFAGLHALERSEMSSLTVGKASDDEKVGLFVLIDGTVRVVEYTAFPKSLAAMRNADGSRTYDLANIAVHMFNREFIERVVSGRGGASLPWHRALKTCPFVDPKSGRPVKPKKPNAVKAEMFVFDALPLAERSMLLGTTRRERFSPVKNLEGVDSAETARRDMTRRWADWLQACGVNVPRRGDGQPDCVIEISPLRATDPESLRQSLDPSVRIEPGATFLLE